MGWTFSLTESETATIVSKDQLGLAIEQEIIPPDSVVYLNVDGSAFDTDYNSEISEWVSKEWYNLLNSKSKEKKRVYLAINLGDVNSRRTIRNVIRLAKDKCCVLGDIPDNTKVLIIVDYQKARTMTSEDRDLSELFSLCLMLD